MKFLGFRISYNKIKPSIERSQGIVEYKTPASRKEVQRLLGTINYDRSFIKSLSQLAAQLYKLLAKEKKFEWNEEHNKAFEKLKDKWKQELELMIPDMNGNFELETDASDIGIGAVLKQNNKPVAYISRILTDAEKHYSIT